MEFNKNVKINGNVILNNSKIKFPEEMLILQEILDKQKEFQKNLGNDIHSKEFIKEMFLGLMCESSEALQELNWKNWKKDKPENRDDFVEEMADIYLFFSNILISRYVGMDELMASIKKKQDKNIQRQKDGY